MQEFNSPMEYAQSLIDSIIETEKSLPENEQMPIELLTFWCEEIHQCVDQYWEDYLAGKRDDYHMDEDEFTAVYNAAGLLYTETVVTKLVDDGYVQMGVNADGDFVYSATDKGREYLNNRNEE